VPVEIEEHCEREGLNKHDSRYRAKYLYISRLGSIHDLEDDYNEQDDSDGRSCLIDTLGKDIGTARSDDGTFKDDIINTSATINKVSGVVLIVCLPVWEKPSITYILVQQDVERMKIGMGRKTTDRMRRKITKEGKEEEIRTFVSRAS